ncbi:hypothetical protein LCGC14_3006310, partial [marine sediment metagenome]
MSVVILKANRSSFTEVHPSWIEVFLPGATMPIMFMHRAELDAMLSQESI